MPASSRTWRYVLDLHASPGCTNARQMIRILVLTHAHAQNCHTLDAIYMHAHDPRLGSPAATLSGSLFGRGRACHAPMQVRYFAYMATHVCMPGTAMTLDAIGVYMHAHDLPNLALPQHPRGVPFSAVHAPACINAGTSLRIYIATHVCMLGISMMLDVIIGVYIHAWALPAQLGPPSATSRVVCFWRCTSQPCTKHVFCFGHMLSRTRMPTT